MGVRSVCLGQSRSLLIRFCHGIWARDHGNIAIWWAIPRSVSEHPSFPSALIVFRKLPCITSNVRYEPLPGSDMNSRRSEARLVMVFSLSRPQQAAETAGLPFEPAKIPANCGLFGRDQEQPVGIELRGGPGSCRTMFITQPPAPRCGRNRPFDTQRVFSRLPAPVPTKNLIQV